MSLQSSPCVASWCVDKSSVTRCKIIMEGLQLINNQTMVLLHRGSCTTPPSYSCAFNSKCLATRPLFMVPAQLNAQCHAHFYCHWRLWSQMFASLLTWSRQNTTANTLIVYSTHTSNYVHCPIQTVSNYSYHVIRTDDPMRTHSKLRYRHLRHHSSLLSSY